MASGFMQRYQGKIVANTLYMGSLTPTKGGIFLRYNGRQISPADLNGLSGRASQSTDPGNNGTLSGYGVTALSSSSGTRILPTPAVGLSPTYYADLASTGGLRKLFTGSTLITFDGTNDVLTSSAAGSIQLLGLSTARWAITSNTGAGTLGTTT